MVETNSYSLSEQTLKYCDGIYQLSNSIWDKDIPQEKHEDIGVETWNGFNELGDWQVSYSEKQFRIERLGDVFFQIYYIHANKISLKVGGRNKPVIFININLLTKELDCKYLGSKKKQILREVQDELEQVLSDLAIQMIFHLGISPSIFFKV